MSCTTRHILQLKNLNSLLILFISCISFVLFEMVSFENHQYTLKLSQPLTKNKTKKRRIVLKCYLTAAHKNREAILMAFSGMQISKTRGLKIDCKTVGFFSKSVKKSVKRGAKRASLTRMRREKKNYYF